MPDFFDLTLYVSFLAAIFTWRLARGWVGNERNILWKLDNLREELIEQGDAIQSHLADDEPYSSIEWKLDLLLEELKEIKKVSSNSILDEKDFARRLTDSIENGDRYIPLEEKMDDVVRELFDLQNAINSLPKSSPTRF
jgi:hypothetical protein